MSQDAANVLEFNLDDVFVGASSGDSDWFPDDESGSETYDESVCETDASGCETEASRFSDEEECQIKEVQEVILPNMEEPKMTPGTKYNSVEEFRLALRQYCVVKEVEVKIVKSGPSRVTAVCADDSCKWRIHASRLRDGMTFQVKTLNDGHSCSSVNKRGNKLAGHRWIASKILSWLKNDPHLTIHTISTRLSEKYHLSLPYSRYISDYYTVARYKLAYGNSINPMTEKDEWEKVDVNKVKPPLVNRQPGRPQNARRKGKDEAGGPSRAKRVHVCKNCGVHGHRASTCTVPGEDVATTCSDPIRPRGRPKNTNTVTRARNPTNRMVLLSDGTTIGEPSRRAIPDVLRDTPDIVTQESRNSILTYVRRRRKAT